jgi:hypothetical protein
VFDIVGPFLGELGVVDVGPLDGDAFGGVGGPCGWYGRAGHELLQYFATSFLEVFFGGCRENVLARRIELVARVHAKMESAFFAGRLLRRLFPLNRCVFWIFC